MSNFAATDRWLASVSAAFGRTCGPGLTEKGIARLEDAAALRIPEDLRALMHYCSPDPQRADWRKPKCIDDFMSYVADGIWFDFEENNHWVSYLGERPPDTSAKSRKYFDSLMAGVPKLIPLQGHRCLPAQPTVAGNPVLSVVQTDIIVYGPDLLEWAAHERDSSYMPTHTPNIVPFWTEAFLGYD